MFAKFFKLYVYNYYSTMRRLVSSIALLVDIIDNDIILDAYLPPVV